MKKEKKRGGDLSNCIQFNGKKISENWFDKNVLLLKYF